MLFFYEDCLGGKLKTIWVLAILFVRNTLGESTIRRGIGLPAADNECESGGTPDGRSVVVTPGIFREC